MSNIKLIKDSLKGSVSGHSLQVVLNQPYDLKQLESFSNRLSGFKAVRNLYIIDFIAGLNDYLSELINTVQKQLPDLQSICFVIPDLSIKSNLNAYQALYTSKAKVTLMISNPGKIVSKKTCRSSFPDHLKSEIQALIEKNIPVKGYFTVSPENCLFADDMLLYCEASGIRDFIFKPTTGVSPHYFNTEDRFHTAQFYKKLAKFNSPDFNYSNFYENLFLEYADLTILKKPELPDKNMSVSIDLAGNSLSYPNYDFVPHSSLTEIAQRGFKKISGIIKNKITHSQKTTFDAGIINPAKINNPNDWKRVLITGWYGTETAGDKAILGEVLHFIKNCSPGCKIILTTIFDHVSLQTNLELDDLKDVQLVNIKKGHAPDIIEQVDAVFMGGGPLMESQSMIDVFRIFKEANRQHKARIVFGCGVGPIHTERIEKVTTAILKMSTAGFTRDEESYHFAGRLFPDHVLKFACDPAVGFINRWRIERLDPSLRNSTNRIVGLLRENTNEFVPNQSKKDLFEFNTSIAGKLADILKPVCQKNGLQADLLHMNAPWIGGDDRIFNRILEQVFSNQSLVRTERSYLTLEALINSLYISKASIAMRYHGHIFSMALGIPFLSIDYTGKKGKIQCLVERIGYEQWSEKWENIDPKRAALRLNKLIEERDHWSQHLLSETNRLVNLLHATYQEVFPEVNFAKFTAEAL